MTTTTTNTTIVKVNSFEQAERDACRTTAEDWMCEEVFNENGIEVLSFFDPATDKQVMIQTTVNGIAVIQVYLEDFETMIWKVEK